MSVKVITEGEIQFILNTIDQIFISDFFAEEDLHLPATVKNDLEEAFRLLLAIMDRPNKPIPESDEEEYDSGC